ncbi:alpha/beta hydrolase [Streptomyces sp. M19]
MAKIRVGELDVHVQRMPAAGPPTDGPPPLVVLVHGLLIDSLASYYFSLGPAFAERGMDVLMYDLRGHGRTGRPATGYRLEDFVADLDGLLDALGEDRPAHVVGNSFGGAIAYGLAAARPDRVRSVIAIESEPPVRAWAEKMAEGLTGEEGGLVVKEVRTWLAEDPERNARPSSSPDASWTPPRSARTSRAAASWTTTSPRSAAPSSPSSAPTPNSPARPTTWPPPSPTAAPSSCPTRGTRCSWSGPGDGRPAAGLARRRHPHHREGGLDGPVPVRRAAPGRPCQPGRRHRRRAGRARPRHRLGGTGGPGPPAGRTRRARLSLRRARPGARPGRADRGPDRRTEGPAAFQFLWESFLIPLADHMAPGYGRPWRSSARTSWSPTSRPSRAASSPTRSA